jgi:hypothetical protein
MYTPAERERYITCKSIPTEKGKKKELEHAKNKK